MPAFWFPLVSHWRLGFVCFLVLLPEAAGELHKWGFAWASAFVLPGFLGPRISGSRGDFEGLPRQPRFQCSCTASQLHHHRQRFRPEFRVHWAGRVLSMPLLETGPMRTAHHAAAGRRGSARWLLPGSGVLLPPGPRQAEVRGEEPPLKEVWLSVVQLIWRAGRVKQRGSRRPFRF